MEFPELKELKRQVEELKYRNERLQMLLDSTVALTEYRMRRIFELEDENSKLKNEIKWLKVRLEAESWPG